MCQPSPGDAAPTSHDHPPLTRPFVLAESKSDEPTGSYAGPSARPPVSRPVGSSGQAEIAAADPQLASRYRPLRLHAKGGLGEVHVAVDQELHRQVALKCLQLRHADDPESCRRFLLEAEITGQLEHPGI